MKRIILLLVVTLLVGCDAMTLTVEQDPYYNMIYKDSSYDRIHRIMHMGYNYNYIHTIYMEDPRWFYDNYYIDSHGQARCYNTHPFFRRYIRERNLNRVQLNRRTTSINNQNRVHKFMKENNNNKVKRKTSTSSRKHKTRRSH